MSSNLQKWSISSCVLLWTSTHSSSVLAPRSAADLELENPCFLLLHFTILVEAMVGMKADMV